MWFIRRSSDGGVMMKKLGLPGDVPMPGDYDGDRKSDLAVFRTSNGFWYICSSSSGYDCDRYSAEQFGLPGDFPIRGDFDGDGILDLAVWRPGHQSLYFKSSRNGEAFVLQWGLPKDVPLGTSPSK